VLMGHPRKVCVSVRAPSVRSFRMGVISDLKIGSSFSSSGRQRRCSFMRLQSLDLATIFECSGESRTAIASSKSIRFFHLCLRRSRRLLAGLFRSWMGRGIWSYRGGGDFLCPIVLVSLRDWEFVGSWGDKSGLPYRFIVGWGNVCTSYQSF